MNLNRIMSADKYPRLGLLCKTEKSWNNLTLIQSFIQYLDIVHQSHRLMIFVMNMICPSSTYIPQSPSIVFMYRKDVSSVPVHLVHI